MDLQTLHRLITYHYWARDRMLAPVATLSHEAFTRDLGSSFTSVRDTVTHLYVAEWAWCERWHGRSPSGPPPVAFDDVPALVQAWTELEQRVRGFVAGLTAADVDRVIEYRLLSGRPGASSVAEMVLHLVNHGSYHRGQVTTLLRQLGAASPASTDMITFFWE